MSQVFGWTCHNCGVFVYNGTSHVCGVGQQYANQYYWWPQPEQLLPTLERIAVALEKLAGITKSENPDVKP